MQEFFEYYFDFDGLQSKYARSLPSVSGDEFHNYYEFVFFLGGKARFISKNIQEELKIGSVIYVPKNSFHQFVVNDCDYTRFILKFREHGEFANILQSLDSEPLMIEEPSGTIRFLADGLVNLKKDCIIAEEAELYLYSVIVQLLFEFRKQKGKADTINLHISEMVHDALLLIDRIYMLSGITVKEIANKLHTSESLLSHKFRTETNISVYKYLTKKRLATARALIESGVNITTAAKESGFSDYSCFYRLYKKHYGCVPSVSKE